MARSGGINFRKIFSREGEGLFAAFFAFLLVLYYGGGEILLKIKEEAAAARPNIIAEKAITDEARFVVESLKDKIIAEVMSSDRVVILKDEKSVPKTAEDSNVTYIMHDPYQEGVVIRNASGDIHLQGNGMIEDLGFKAENDTVAFTIKAEHPMFKDDSILSEGNIPISVKQDLPEGKALKLESDKAETPEDLDI